MGEITITRMNASLGGLVEGVDLAQIGDAQFVVIRQALLDHHVLFFRNQHLTDDGQLALVRRWADPMLFPITALMGGKNALGRVEDTAESPPDADGWHTDITWWHRPPSVAVLCALDIPAEGGDTMWANLHKVYDKLSEPMQRICNALLSVLHTPGERFIAANARIFGPEHGKLIAENFAGAHHPLVRSHPVTGRPAVFLSGSFMRTVDGLSADESAMLLGFLTTLLNDPNLQVRWRWRVGDVAIWDEASTDHRALSDHYPQYRLMRRCTAEGELPWFSPDGRRANATIVSRPVRDFDLSTALPAASRS